VRFSGFILLPIYTRAFGRDGNGLLAGVNNLSALLIALTMLGLDGAVPLLYFETDNHQQKRRICSLWIYISLIVSVPVTLLLVVFSDWVSLLATGTKEHAGLFALGAAVLPFSLLQLVFSNILRLTFRPRAYALLNLGLTVLIALISIYLVVFRGLGLEGALWANLAGTFLIVLAGAWVIRDVVRLADLGKASPSSLMPTARRLVKLGLPLVPASLALWIISFSNTYFLLQLIGPGEAGVFRVGSQVAVVLGLALFAFQLAWTPFSLSIAREPDAPRVYSRVATLYMAGAVGASVLLAAVSPILIRIIATEEFAAATSVIGLQALAAAALGAYYVVSIGVNLAQRTGQIAWTTITAAALNVALNALLIPLWGMIGAGIALLAANLTSTTLVYVVSQRFYPLPYQPLKMLFIWLSGSLCVALASIINVTVHPPLVLSVALAVVLLAAYTLGLFVASIITARELAAAWSSLMDTIARRFGRL
jgi:O-antigen/teichoic acid export membrane protein